MRNSNYSEKQKVIHHSRENISPNYTTQAGGLNIVAGPAPKQMSDSESDTDRRSESDGPTLSLAGTQSRDSVVTAAA